MLEAPWLSMRSCNGKLLFQAGYSVNTDLKSFSKLPISTHRVFELTLIARIDLGLATTSIIFCYWSLSKALG